MRFNLRNQSPAAPPSAKAEQSSDVGPSAGQANAPQKLLTLRERLKTHMSADVPSVSLAGQKRARPHLNEFMVSTSEFNDVRNKLSAAGWKDKRFRTVHKENGAEVCLWRPFAEREALGQSHYCDVCIAIHDSLTKAQVDEIRQCVRTAPVTALPAAAPPCRRLVPPPARHRSGLGAASSHHG